MNFEFRGGSKMVMPNDRDFTIQWDVYFDEMDAGNDFMLLASTNDFYNGLLTRYNEGTFWVQPEQSNENVDPSLSLSTSRWHHMAMVYDNAADTARIYVDGIDTGYICHNSLGTDDPLRKLFFGFMNSHSVTSMRLDNIEIYEGKLPEQMLQTTEPQITLIRDTANGTVSAYGLLDAPMGSNGFLVLAQYGDDGMLLKVKETFQEVTVPAAATTDSNPDGHGYNEFTVADTLDSNTKTVRAFFWDSSHDMNPYNIPAEIIVQ